MSELQEFLDEGKARLRWLEKEEGEATGRRFECELMVDALELRLKNLAAKKPTRKATKKS